MTPSLVPPLHPGDCFMLFLRPPPSVRPDSFGGIAVPDAAKRRR